MPDITIRNATDHDIGFIIETIIMAEKGNGPNVSYCALFNISDSELRLILRKIFLEKIDNFEFSLSSFKIAEHKGNPVAAYGAWIEGKSGMSSGLLKMSAFKEFLNRESLIHYSQIAHISDEIGFKRSTGTLQFESLYILEQFRGMRIGQILAQALIDDLLKSNPGIQTAQLQLIKQNEISLKGQLKFGFEVVSEKSTDNPDIFKFYPGNTRVLMEKKLSNGK